MKLVGVMMARQAEDLLAVNLPYHRAMGFDEIRVVDNGSTDRTPALLRSIASQDPGIRWTTDPGPFLQARVTTELARDAVADGADWVVPIDADEFWWHADGSIRGVLERADPTVDALIAQVVNFVQRRRVHRPHPAVLLSMTSRAVVHTGPDDAREQVTAGACAFVEIDFPPKLVHRARPDLAIGKGNHNVVGSGRCVVPAPGLVVLHAPLRAREVIGSRIEHGERVAQVEPDPSTSWYAKRLRQQANDAATREAEWAANSSLRRHLDGGSWRHRVVPDRRLHDAVSPFITRRERWLRHYWLGFRSARRSA